MDCLVAIKERRSIRKFRGEPVPEEKLQVIMEAAQDAPSAGNLQAREFILVRDSQIKGELARAALNQTFIQEAPVVVVVCTNPDRSTPVYGVRGELYTIQDAMASVMNILLAAHALGLGTCCVGAFEEVWVKSVLRIPPNIQPIAIVPVGYPAEKPSPPPRRKIKLHMDGW